MDIDNHQELDKEKRLKYSWVCTHGPSPIINTTVKGSKKRIEFQKQ